MKKSFNSSRLLQATVASIIGFTTNAHAGSDATPGVNTEWEKCYGVVKAGENDCSSLNGSHGCAGHAESDNDLNEFIWLPKSACVRVVNGVSYKVNKSKNIKKWCESAVNKIGAQKNR
jgi:uncharacterized membrane protein